MASTQALSAAASDRKARLAQLKSLKRKAPEAANDSQQDDEAAPFAAAAEPATDDVTSRYVSGRNYDHSTKGAKLGFENGPDQGQTTLELKAAELAAQTKQQAEEEEKNEAPLDLFKLQPKKPNWDLKRDLDQKLGVLNVRTDNAIARLVRERIQKQQEAAKARGNEQAQGGDVEAQGIEGATLVEATNVREREDEEEARREREEEDALLDGS
ncbi:Putative mRNA splicing factor Cwf18 [Septoria linicola]|uniref:mRNA splicing factor Cwf18 n=1 Tax=Septoria linicola TaxID=215465 RepID=A0A9Q9B092_9PEZI|nr:putative mRNA splicing factor Cwf18 [Septoria linicola]USW58609.1 Putative mRNA splicing factor Cwf18 [Septoria linicola]